MKHWVNILVKNKCYFTVCEHTDIPVIEPNGNNIGIGEENFIEMETNLLLFMLMETNIGTVMANHRDGDKPAIIYSDGTQYGTKWETPTPTCRPIYCICWEPSS
jgi:hypothetical protein